MEEARWLISVKCWKIGKYTFYEKKKTLTKDGLNTSVISTVIAQAANVDRVEVVPAPRELDPEVLVWKGATVMAKLDSAKDMWIGPKEWEEVGARCLRERALLM